MKLVHEEKLELYSRDKARHRAICNFQRRGSRRTSNCDNIRRTSIIVILKRKEILQVSRLTGDENFVSKKNQ